MAIAFDAASMGNFAASSCTLAHTVTGTNPGLLVFIVNYAHVTDVCTGVTYGGVAMTRLSNVNNVLGASVWAYWLAESCPTGANNIVASFSGSESGEVIGVSYTGVNQSNTVDASILTSSSSSSTLASALTSIADNCWHIGCCLANSRPFSAGASTYLWKGDTLGYNIAVFDNGAAITPAGSNTINEGATGATAMRSYDISIAPYVATASFIPQIIMS